MTQKGTPEATAPSAAAAQKTIAIFHLQQHLRELRALQVSDQSVPHSAQEQLHLTVEINNVLIALKAYGAVEEPAQA